MTIKYAGLAALLSTFLTLCFFVATTHSTTRAMYLACTAFIGTACYDVLMGILRAKGIVKSKRPFSFTAPPHPRKNVRR